MKRKYVCVIAATAVLALAGTGTAVSLAYQTDQEEQSNDFDMPKLDVPVEEEFPPPGDVKPGSVIVKKPRAVNKSQVACYVRMRVAFTNAADEICEPLAIREGWVKKEDGFYYWTGKLQPGEKTGNLFEQVTIRSDVKQEEIVPFEVQVYSEAALALDLSMEDAWKLTDG